MNIAAQLQKSAICYPERPAISLGEKEIVVYSYRDLHLRVARLAAAISESYRIVPGDRVALAMQNAPDYLVIMYAIWHAGAAIVPINAKLHPKECQYILASSGAKLCFASDSLAGALQSEIAEDFPIISVGSSEYEALFDVEPIPLVPRAPTDLAWLFYTSGTTGKPKGAMLTHRNLMAEIMSFYADMQWITEEDTILHVAPMSHGSGLYALPYVAKGGTNVIPESAGFIPEGAFDLIACYPNSSLFLAPTMITRMLNAPDAAQKNTDNLKAIFYGGAPMYVQDLLRALDLFGPKLIQLYGQGEAPMTITALSRRMHINDSGPRYLARLASAGIPRTDVEVRVVDSNGVDLPIGEQGEIVVSGDVVMAGYWQDPEATREAIRDGWLYTGDVGKFDQDGFLTLLDRSKDVIIFRWRQHLSGARLRMYS